MEASSGAGDREPGGRTQLETPVSISVWPQLQPHEKKFLLWFTLGTLILAASTFLLGNLLAPTGQTFIGYPFNTDDHMVYAAWMWQSAHGHFLFDNRFTFLPQPAATIHLYYWFLGLIAKGLGITWTSNLARIGLIAVVIPLLYRLISMVTPSIYARKLCLTIATYGGGIGFLAWQDYGRTLSLPRTMWMQPLTGGYQPTDLWQPEGYLFPSLLTNGLFVASFCLILATLLAVLAARDRKELRWLIGGVVAFGVLMNIHSYDCLLVALILVGFLVTTVKSRSFGWGWASRCVLIGAGAIPAALWFTHVLKIDPIFASRAATPTYAAPFKAEIIGYLPLILLALPTLTKGASKKNPSRLIGIGLLALLVFGLYFAPVPQSGYFLNQAAFISCLILALISIWFLASKENQAKNVMIAWGIIGLIAPYFPALYERKLAMGLALPWGILAGIGIYQLTQTRLRANRNFASVFFLLILSGSSVQWVFRDIRFIQKNVSSTTVQPAYLTGNEERIIDYLADQAAKGKVTVIAIPGIPTPEVDSVTGKTIDGSYDSPMISDLNPLVSGLAGVYTYAGHWSETPDYMRMRTISLQNLFMQPAGSPNQKLFLSQVNPDYIITITPGAIPNSPFSDLSALGQVVVAGNQFELIKVNPTAGN